VYLSCIFCSSGLGVNESNETLQVGSRLAFDAGKKSPTREQALAPIVAIADVLPFDPLERWGPGG
jgi:hypothetical protein